MTARDELESPQGIKLGAAMLQDAVNRAIAVSQNTGIRALLVHAGGVSPCDLLPSCQNRQSMPWTVWFAAALSTPVEI